LSSRKLDWNVKLLILFAAVLIATLLVQVFYIIPYVQNRDLQNAQTHGEEIIHNIAREADMDLNHLVGSLTAIAEQAVFRNMIIENQTEIMFQYVDISPEISALFVMNSTGWFVSGTVEDFAIRFTTHSYADRLYFITPFEQDEFYYGPVWWYGSKPELVGTSVSVPIKSETGERIGVLMGSMRLNGLIENVANYPLEEETIAFIVDENGIVVAHSEIDLFALEDGPRSLNFSYNHLVQELMTGKTNITELYDHNSTDYYGYGVLLSSNSWGVIVDIPLSKIVAQTNALVMNLWLINVGLFGVALVVTVLVAKQTTGELRNAQEKLLSQERLAILGQLGAGIGHELRDPLAAIKNAAYFLRMVFKEPAPEVKETIDIIEKEVVTSERIISSLLSYVRPKPATRSKVDINDVIAAALSTVTMPGTIEVVSQLDEGIPTILADPDQLRQVFVNLILNAFQAMPKGGRLVVKSWSPGPGSVDVSIADTGVGIPQENLPKLFNPLFTTKANVFFLHHLAA